MWISIFAEEEVEQFAKYLQKKRVLTDMKSEEEAGRWLYVNQQCQRISDVMKVNTFSSVRT